MAYVVAICVILFAVLVCVSRLLTPILDKHRPDFEKWASALLETPVTIDKVNVSWYRYQPEISLKQVTVLDKDTKQPLLQVKSVNIIFSIPQSIWQRKVVPNGIMVSGADINIRENTKNEYTIQGFPALHGFNDKPYENETKASVMLGWLMTQPRLILRDIDVRYTGFTGQKRFVTLYDLSLNNNDIHHMVLGKAILHQDIPTEVTLAVQWQGQTLNLAEIKAKIYLYVSGLSLTQWLQGFSWQGWQVNKGIISAKIWANWSHGAFHKIQATFQSYGLDLYSQTDKTQHIINRLSGNIGWQQEGKKQIFAGDDILIDLPEHLWPVSSFYVALQPDASGKLIPRAANFGYLDLSDLQSFLFSSPNVLSDETKKLLTGLKLKGGLQNTVMTFGGAWTDLSHISMNVNFSRLSVTPWHQFPGAANLSGEVRWNGVLGEMSFNSNRAEFYYDSVFSNPIDVDQLSGSVKWQREPTTNNLVLTIPSLQVLNNDAAANVSGTLTILPDMSTSADITANFTMQKAQHVSRYLPMKIFDRDLVAWLQQAFLSGEVQSGHLDLRGKLADFPFDNKNGTFLISGHVRDIDFRFAPDWPLLNRVNGVVTFSGRQMTVDVEKAQTLGVDIAKVHGFIPYFGDAQSSILEIQADDVHTDFSRALNYVRHSPLEKSIGKMFDDIDMTGAVILKLGLMIPLSHTDKTQVQGDLTLTEAAMNMVPWGLQVTKLNGLVQFTETTTTAKEIQGELFNKPLQFSLASVPTTKQQSIVRAHFTNNIAIADLEEWLKIPFSKMAKGSTNVEGELDFSLQAPLVIRLRSNLLGISIDLPEAYGKKNDEKREFSANITVQPKQPLRMQLNYADLLGAALILDKRNESFNLVGANLHFGGGLPEWPASSGIYISGEFDKLDWDKIKSYMTQSTNTSFASNFSHLPLKEIDITTNNLTIAGQHLNQVHLQVIPSQRTWKIAVISPSVVGQLQIPMTMTKQSIITAQFQKLSLHSLAQSQNTVIDVKSLPALMLTANDVTYNDIPIGQITFNAIPKPNGLAVQSLRMTSRYLNLQATGDWLQTNRATTTHLQGKAVSTNVSNLLSSFGFDVRNFVSGNGRLDFNLNWADAPYTPTLASMNGSARLDLGMGRIVDIGQENGAKMDLGRMLSIFSLQTIPRRLAFDFSDVFQKGYSFDYVRGDFTLQNGDAHTSNLLFDGPVARVGINGRIGLKNKNLNFTMIITPYVTSSIPVAATLITGQPLIGLAALAVSSVIGSQVSKVTTYYYDVTGSWDNPVWKSVKVDSTK